MLPVLKLLRILRCGFTEETSGVLQPYTSRVTFIDGVKKAKRLLL